MKHQLSIMKQTASQTQKAKCGGGFVGHTWVLSYYTKLMLTCKSLLQNNSLISDLIGEAVLILCFEVITTDFLRFLFTNTLLPGDTRQYFLNHDGIILQF